eukprot:TRINITY_DN2_c0_g4_i1.p1 TRINITY_DN2_c0_g4~~TRINITY_DN2_c0_g4_i1.p1  ORF type:complete len:405 (+),score=124.00 TRINITY_DN2_c0_g4_i1:60-1274(+)
MKLFGALFSAFSVSAAISNVPIMKGSFAQAEQLHIVVFNENATLYERAKHIAAVQPKIKYTYDIGDFHGYAAYFTEGALSAVQNAAEVQFTEADGIAYALQDSCNVQSDATWGLTRIDERGVDLDDTYTYTGAGEGVNAYVIDTGIFNEHVDFEGRAVFGANFVDGETDEDCNGHGTHVAGTIGGAEWGVAKKTTLIGVKVLSCSGSGTWAGVIGGIDWTAADAKTRKGRSVANMSLGGGKTAALNLAVAAAVKSGVVMVVAAGNENQNACNVSPASEPLAITVGATTVTNNGGVTQSDQRASFSNFGTCVDIFAPGQLITSAWIGKTTATSTISGTSMASPHVAGVAALFLQANPDVEAADVSAQLVAVATPNVINLACRSTDTVCRASPNVLAYVAGCSDSV